MGTEIRTSAATAQSHGGLEQPMGQLSLFLGSASPAPPPLSPAPPTAPASSCIDLIERALVLPRYIALQRQR